MISTLQERKPPSPILIEEEKKVPISTSQKNKFERTRGSELSLNKLQSDSEPSSQGPEQEPRADIFLYKVIHDLRHPLQAMKEIVNETKEQVQHRESKFGRWFKKNTKFKVKKNMQPMFQTLIDAFKQSRRNQIEESESGSLQDACEVWIDDQNDESSSHDAYEKFNASVSPNMANNDGSMLIQIETPK